MKLIKFELFFFLGFYEFHFNGELSMNFIHNNYVV